MSNPIDSRELFVEESVTFEDVAVGDFVRPGSGWSRPRLVAMKDVQAGEGVLFLEEPDTARRDANGLRRVTHLDWEGRGDWTRFPNLAKVWAQK